MRTDKVTLRARTVEVAEALATLGPTAAHEAMRSKYQWSRRTWFHYQARAYAYLAEHAQCPDEARNALIVRLQRYMADPTCNHAAKARYTDSWPSSKAPTRRPSPRTLMWRRKRSPPQCKHCYHLLGPEILAR